VIKLCCGPRVQPDGGATFVLPDLARREKCEVVEIDSHPELDGHRNALRILHGGADDVSKEIRLEWNGRSTALSRDFRDRTSKVHVEVVDTPVIHETLHGLGDVVRIRPVKLKAARRFIRAKIGKLERFIAAVDQRTCVDHLTDIKSGPKLLANRTERVVRDTRHRRQHDRRPDGNLSDFDRRKFARLRGPYIAINGTAIHRVHLISVGPPSLFYGTAIAAERQERYTQMARLYIGNLPHLTAEHELQTWVEQNGFKVESVQVIRDLDTGASRGFAFIELPEVRNAQEAVDVLNGQKMEGNNLRVSEARPIPFKVEGRQIGGTRSPRKKAS